MKFISMLALALTMGASIASAQEAPTPTTPTPAVNSTAKTIKEIFLKGSIDGKSLFIVLGVEDAADHLKDAYDLVITENDIEGYQDRTEKMGEHVYSKDHDDDFVNATKEGINGMKDFAPRILSAPWKSLKEIPKSFQVDLNNGREAFAKSQSQITGALKFSGWAAWACIQGSYYLVLEAPVRFAANLIGTTMAVPFMEAVQLTRVAWDATCLAVRSITIGIKAVGITAYAGIVAGYSLLSSTTATAVTLVTAGGIAVFKGAKFLLFDAPRMLVYPLSAKVKTTIEFNDKEEEDLGNKLAAYYSAANNDLGITRMESDIGKFSSKMKLFTKNQAGEEIQFGVMKVSIVERMVRVRMDVRRVAYKDMKRSGLSRAEIEQMVKNSIEKAVKASVDPTVVVTMQ